MGLMWKGWQKTDDKYFFEVCTVKMTLLYFWASFSKNSEFNQPFFSISEPTKKSLLYKARISAEPPSLVSSALSRRCLHPWLAPFHPSLNRPFHPPLVSLSFVLDSHHAFTSFFSPATFHLQLICLLTVPSSTPPPSFLSNRQHLWPTASLLPLSASYSALLWLPFHTINHFDPG